MKSKHFKKLGTTAVILLVSVCFIPAIAGAFSPGEGRQGKGFHRENRHRPALGIWRNPQIVQKLELTENQIKQIRDADFIFREKHLALKTQLDGFRLKMDKAFSDDVVDDKAVLKMAQKIAEVKGKMFVQKTESRLALKNILNEEQMKKLKMCKPERQKRKVSKRAERHLYGYYSMERPGDITNFENE